MHTREAASVLAAMAEADPEWAELSHVDRATVYLSLGSIAPDFRQLSPAVAFGHDKALSLHLLSAAAEESPQLRLFALGHLAHVLSDTLADVFFAPALFATTPSEVYQFFEGSDDATADTETVVETYGDLLLGTWGPVVELLFEFLLDGPDARDRLQDALTWYCEEGATFYGLDTDCAVFLADVEAQLATAEELLGGFDRDGARELVDTVLGRPPAELADLFSGGLLDLFSGGLGEPVAAFGQELERFRRGPYTDRGAWAVYDGLDAVTAGWAARVIATGEIDFPQRNDPVMIAGNIASLLAFLPEAYDTSPALLIDRLAWRDGSGESLRAVPRGDDGDELHVTARVLPVLPFVGRVRGVVRRDRPGLTTESDEIVGEASMEVDYDPLDFARREPPSLDVPFAARTHDAVGFYFELYVGDAARPSFTTSWDRLWTSGQIALDRPIYRERFGTYGRWPPSLPIEGAPHAAGQLFVVVRNGWGGPGVDGAVVTVTETEPRTAGPNGLVTYDSLPAGDQEIEASRDGFAPFGGVAGGAARVEAATSGDGRTWVDVVLLPVPTPVVEPTFVGPGGCVDVDWEAAAFGGAVDRFLVGASGGDVVLDERDAGRRGRASLCELEMFPEGVPVAATLRAEYPGARSGPTGASTPFFVDRTRPTLADAPIIEARATDECEGRHTFRVSWQVDELISPSIAASARIDGGPAIDASVEEGEAAGRFTVVFDIVVDRLDDVPSELELEAVDSAGNVARAAFSPDAWPAPSPDPCDSAVEADEDRLDAAGTDAADATPPPAEDAGPLEPGGAGPPGNGGGCSVSAAPARSSGFAWIAAILFACRRRRIGRGR